MPTLSVVITTFNEGPELHRTLQSVIKNTQRLHEIVIVDDGSDDGSCEGFAHDTVRVIRNPVRTGIAFSRNLGSRAATGDVLCYLDSHQRVSPGCLDRCAEYALENQSIVTPDIRDYGLFGWRLHGARFELCPKRGYFSARWRQWFQLARERKITGLRAPPYLIPSSLYPAVAWCSQMRGWGASEASVGVKAFFTDSPIVHLRGPVSGHRFQRGSHFPVTWEEMYRNQAMIARVCFSEATWRQHWLPLLESHLSAATRSELESSIVLAEHEEFAARKRKLDREFWTELLRRPVPVGLKSGGLKWFD